MQENNQCQGNEISVDYLPLFPNSGRSCSDIFLVTQSNFPRIPIRTIYQTTTGDSFFFPFLVTFNVVEGSKAVPVITLIITAIDHYSPIILSFFSPS